MARVLTLWEERHIKEMSMKRQERHDPESPRYARQALETAADIIECFDRPCLLENPALALILETRGRDIVSLGVRDHAHAVRGFKMWDVRRPAYITRAFDVVLCDAMDPTLSLRELRQAVRVLTHFKPRTPLMVACPASRKDAFLRVFADFELEPTGFRASLENPESMNGEVEFYANFDLPT